MRFLIAIITNTKITVITVTIMAAVRYVVIASISIPISGTMNIVGGLSFNFDISTYFIQRKVESA